MNRSIRLIASTLLLNASLTIPLAVSAAESTKTAGQHGADGHAEGMAGAPGKVADVSRVVEVSMADTMRFAPSAITVKKGQTVRFVVKNQGQVKHEMVLGSPAELKEHAQMMQKMPGMEHADANTVALDAGKTGELIWHFTQAGTVDFACLQPGHFEAGMRGAVTVAAK